MSNLQPIIDQLAQATGRAAAIHDQRGRILAYSSHDDAVDEVRRRSILARRAPADSLAWSRSLGLEDASGPVRVPANPDFGMTPRLCAPVRFEDELLGLLWLVDPDGDASDDVLVILGIAAENAALAIHRSQLMRELERGRERELLRDLLSEQGDLRRRTAEQMAERNLLTAGSQVVALVVRPVKDRAGMTATDEGMRLALEHALRVGVRAIPPRQSLPLVRHDHGLLVVSVDAAGSPRTIERAATEIHQSMASALEDHDGWRAVVGIGDVRSEVAEAHLSYRHASQVAEVASIVETFSDITRWEELGVYATLLALPLDQLTQESLHPGLVALMDNVESDIWLETLERYLDLGCDAPATANALGIQRGSVYYRLRRLESLAGVDLRRGDDRLALHLGLKLARLKGLLT